DGDDAVAKLLEDRRNQLENERFVVDNQYNSGICHEGGASRGGDASLGCEQPRLVIPDCNDLIRTVDPQGRGSARMNTASLSDALFTRPPDPMWIYDVATLHFIEVNEAALARYGYSRQEFLSMTIADIRPPEDVPDLAATVRTLGQSLNEPA